MTETKAGTPEIPSSGDTSVENLDRFLAAQNEIEEFIPVEYKVVDMGLIPSHELEDTFNEIGKDGWDLVACTDGLAIFSRC